MAPKVITRDIERHIASCYKLGWNALGIHKILTDLGVNISYSYLRCKVMPRLGLCRRGRHRPSDETVRAAIEQITQDSHGQLMSASSMRTVLANSRNIYASKKRVQRIQRDLHPVLVQRRRAGRLNRRAYTSLGPNAQWHADGYDKLAPFGLPIHGAVDGFSRVILWLEVAPSNRQPEQTCQYFLNAVRKFGLPQTVRLDAGTENTNIKLAQQLLSANLERISPLPPTIVGSSNHNERIERFWGLLRLQKMNFWINHFKAMISNGLMVAWDNFDRPISYYCYSHLVREDLVAMVQWHNHHRIRAQKNPNVVTGVPMELFMHPAEYGEYRDCSVQPNPADMLVAEQRLSAHVMFDRDFQVVLDALVHEFGLIHPPPTLRDTDAQYIRLRHAVNERVAGVH